MNQLQLMEPQFECGLFEIWSFGIIDSLIYRVTCCLHNSLEQKLTKFERELDIPSLRSIKPQLYHILLAKSGFLVRKNCADLCDPCDGLTFKYRFLDLVFLNVLREQELLTVPTEYYYESILDVFSQTTFGLTFFIDLVVDQGWYKYTSKFLARFNDLEQVNLIRKELPSLSSDFHLNVLLVIWSIESALNDSQAFTQLEVTTKNLLNQSPCKTFDFKNNLEIYLSLINVTLEEFIGTTARQATRQLGLDKRHDTEDLVNPVLPKVSVTTSPIQFITNFINDLGRNLFPNQELTFVENLKLCLKDPKSESIIEMIASIHELNSFISVLRREVSFPELEFEGFNTIISGWDEWSEEVKMDEILCQQVLTLKRFFTLEQVESRYLTCVIIKHGLPKYFDILESIDIELYLDPFVIFTFCDLIQTESKMEANENLLEDLILVLKRILTSIKSKKRITSLVKARSNFFGLYPLGNVNKTKLSTLLRQPVGGIKLDQIRDEILLAAFLSPYELLDFVIADAVEHSHQMIPFLVKLFSIELNGLMSSNCETKYDNTLFETIIATRLSLVPTTNTIQGLLKLIKEVFLFYIHAKQPVEPLILSLERLMCHLAWDSCVDTNLTAFAKRTVYQLIQALSNQYDHIEWTYVQKEPASLVYSLINMIDYFFKDGSLKTAYVELLAFVMNKKVRRKLTNCEWNWIKKRMELVGDTPILLAYLGPWLEERLSFYFDVKKMNLMNVLLLAVICKDNHWIYLLNRHPIDLDDANLFPFIANLLQFLTRSEFDNLYHFLLNYGLIVDVMIALCSGFADQDRNDQINIDYVTGSLIDCIYSHYLAYLKTPDKYINAWHKKTGQNWVMSESRLLPHLFRKVQLCYLFPDPRPNSRLYNFLEDILKEMVDKKIDLQKALFFSPEAQYNLRTLCLLKKYHKTCYHIPEPHKPKFTAI